MIGLIPGHKLKDTLRPLRMRTCLRIGLLLLVGFLVGFQLSVALAQEESATESVGKLVLVPDDLYVGETTDALGFHLDFPDKAITIVYSEHFAPAGEACDSAEAGTAAFNATPARISLTACSVGEGRVQLMETDTGTLIAEATATITVRQAAARGQQRSTHLTKPDAPSGLLVLAHGQRDISVRWDRLEGATKYRVRAGSLGTEEVDGTGKSFIADPGTTHTFSVQAFGDGTTFLAEWGSPSTDTVTTETAPTVTIRRDSSPVNEGESARFTLIGRPAPIFASIRINIDPGDPDDRLTSDSTRVAILSRNSTTASLSLRTKENSICEDDGTVRATIASPTEHHIYYIGRPSSASVIIRDDDHDDCDDGSTSTPTPTPTPTPPPRPPPVPTQLRANGDLDDDGEVTFRWKAVSGATSYNLRYVEEVCDLRSGVCNFDNRGWVTSSDIDTEGITTTIIGTESTESTTEAKFGFPTEKTLYRVQVNAMKSQGPPSEWSDHVFVFPTNSPFGWDTPVATAYHHGYQGGTVEPGSHVFNCRVCNETIPGSMITANRSINDIKGDITSAVDKWMGAVVWRENPDTPFHIPRNPDNIIITLFDDDMPIFGCSENSQGLPFGKNDVKFVSNRTMWESCADTKENPIDGCWRSSSWATFRIDSMFPGRIFLKHSFGDAWNADDLETGCTNLHRQVVHEMGHGLGIGNGRHLDPINKDLSVMSENHRKNYCQPQAYDIVALMALYQSR